MNLGWKTFFLVLGIVNCQYAPVQIFKFKDEKEETKVVLTHVPRKDSVYSLLSFCPVKQIENESVVKFPEKVFSIALTFNKMSMFTCTEESSNTLYSVVSINDSNPNDEICEFPLQITREINEKTWRSTLLFYSVYGFYLPIANDGFAENEIMSYDTECAHFYGSERIARTEEYSEAVDNSKPVNEPKSALTSVLSDKSKAFFFMQLYLTVDNTKNRILFYRYAITKNSAIMYQTDFPNIVNYIEANSEKYLQDTCNNVKMENIFKESRQQDFLNQYTNKIDKLQQKSTYLVNLEHHVNFRMAHLVPMMHLLFQGLKHANGNCSVVAVWGTIYEYLFEVDKAIFNYAVKQQHHLYITAGYHELLQDSKGHVFHWHNDDDSVVTPALIWKRVIVHDHNGKVDMDKSFTVTITNNIFQYVHEASSPFKKVTPLCSLSCEDVQLMVEKQMRKRVPNENESTSESESLNIDTKSKNKRPSLEHFGNFIASSHKKAKMIVEKATNLLSEKQVIMKYEGSGIVNCCRLSEDTWKKFEKEKGLNAEPRSCNSSLSTNILRHSKSQSEKVQNYTTEDMANESEKYTFGCDESHIEFQVTALHTH